MNPKLKKAINQLTSVNYIYFSEAEVLMDELASGLISEFEPDVSVFWGHAPTLLEVLEILVHKHPELQTASDIMPEVERLMRDAYNYDLGSGVKAMNALLQRLKKTLLTALEND